MDSKNVIRLNYPKGRFLFTALYSSARQYIQRTVYKTSKYNNIVKPHKNKLQLQTALGSVQQHLFFRADLAEWIRLFPKQAPLHLSALYLCPDGSGTRVVSSGCVMSCSEDATHVVAVLFISVRLVVGWSMILAAVLVMCVSWAQFLTESMLKRQQGWAGWFCGLLLLSISVVSLVLLVLSFHRVGFQLFWESCLVTAGESAMFPAS